MKKQYLIRLSLVLLLFAGGIACKKSSGSGDGSEGTMSAKVDGALQTCDLAIEATLSNGVLGLGGRWSSGGGFTMSIPGFTNTTGAFNLGSGNMNIAVVTLGLNATDTYTANPVTGSGKIIITSFSDDNIKGTFEFVG